MKKLILTLLTGAILTIGLPAQAQENLLANKPIYTLGGAKTWSNGDASYTFITDDLQKLVAVPTNTSNVFLYPENGAINNEENQAKGAQVFYIDMEAVTSVGTVTTTWEGAAADSFNIYLTDDVPTEAVLSTTPTYSVSGLGQYTENTAVLKDGSKGRYMVFQVTKATNWGWGVKMRSISAYAPQADELTTFKVSPGIVVANQETPVNITVLNQFGLNMNLNDVEITVSDNAVYEGGKLTIESGSSAIFTASYGGVDLKATVYVPTAPRIPDSKSIKTPIYTNGVTDNNSTAGWETAYRGGAKDLGELTFEGGEVAHLFADAQCIFLYNSVTTGDWNGNINPAEQEYRTLCLDVFSASDTQCMIEFEGVENLAGGHTYYYQLKANEWTSIVVDVENATRLNNVSIRFAEANMADILISNIYFTPTSLGEGEKGTPTKLEITLKEQCMFVGDEQEFSFRIYDEYDIPYESEDVPEITIKNAEIKDGKVIATETGIATLTVEIENLSNSIEIYVADENDYCLNNITVTYDVETPQNDVKNLTDGGKERNTKGADFTLVGGPTTPNAAADHWILVDLNAEYDLDRVIVWWEGACAGEYELLAGASPDEMTPVFNVTGRGEKEWIDHIYGEGLKKVRYIKIHTMNYGTQYGLKIWDLKAYGKLSHPDKVVTVGEMAEALAWHPVGIDIEDLVELNKETSAINMTKDIQVTIEPINFERDFRGKELTKNESGLSDYDWHVYSAIAEKCTVTVKGEPTKGARCDGFLLNNPDASIDENGNFTADIDCSGLYKVTFTGLNGVTFQEDELYSTRIERSLEVYPSIEHKYTYKIDGHTNTDDCFRIDDYYLDYEKGVVYDETEIDKLSNAWIQFPGVYDADFYYYIEPTKGGGDITEGELRIKRKANTVLPSEYSQYTKIEGGRADLSDLAEGGTLHIVVAKNGAVTPLLADGTSSESKISFTTSTAPGETTTGVGSIEESVADATVDVYTLQGIRVMRGVKASEAASQLPAGIYIIGGKKVAVGSK